MPQLPRLLAQGMEKAKKEGPAKLTLASPEALNDLPALPLVGTGVPGSYKLDISNLKSGWTYRAPGGAALFYNGEILVPSTVEIAPAASPMGTFGAPGPAPVEIEPLLPPMASPDLPALAPDVNPHAEEAAEPEQRQQQQTDFFAVAPENESAGRIQFANPADREMYSRHRADIDHQRRILWRMARERDELNEKLKSEGVPLAERLKKLQRFDREIRLNSGELERSRAELSEILARSTTMRSPDSAATPVAKQDQPGSSAKMADSEAEKTEKGLRPRLQAAFEEAPDSFAHHVASQEFMGAVPKLVQANIHTAARNAASAHKQLQRLEQQRQVAVAGLKKRLAAKGLTEAEIAEQLAADNSGTEYIDQRIEEAGREIDMQVGKIARLVGQFTDPAYHAESERIAEQADSRKAFGVSDDSLTGLGIESVRRGLGEAEIGKAGRHFATASERLQESQVLLERQLEERAELTRLLEEGTLPPGLDADHLKDEIARANGRIRWLEGEMKIADDRMIRSVTTVAMGLKKRAGLAPDPATAAMRRAFGEGDVALSIDYFLQDPTGVIMETLTESAGEDVIGSGEGLLAQTVVTPLLPETALVKVLAFGAGAATESAYAAYKAYGKAVVDFMIAKKADFTDINSVRAVWAEHGEEIREFAKEQREISGLATAIGISAGELTDSFVLDNLTSKSIEAALGGDE